mmetsp:Transcript_964/g.1248  ORF Transcript_964/g.1248 Transcript_964/m.1248 type:complete len:386 (+) Transcript_964:51-1208(+)
MLVSQLAKRISSKVLGEKTSFIRNFASLQIPGLDLGHDKDYIVFPKEREGLEYKLNWSLADDGITPTGDAYGNIKLTTLKKKLGLKVGDSTLETSLTATSSKFQEAGNSVSFEEFDVKKASVTEYLSSGVDLFVEDGAAGSFRGSTVGVRVVTDDPIFAMVSKNLLMPIPKKLQAKSQPITVLVSTKCEASMEAVAFDESEDGELVGATIVLSNSMNLSAFTSLLSHAASVVLDENEDLLPLPAAAVTKDSSAGLLVGSSSSLLGQLYGEGALYSAHSSIWAPSGISALLNGAVLPSGAVGGNGVDVKAGEVTCISNPAMNLVAPPKAVLFVGGSQAELGAEEAGKLLAEAGAEEPTVEKFKAKVEATGTKCLRVSSVADVLSAV